MRAAFSKKWVIGLLSLAPFALAKASYAQEVVTDSIEELGDAAGTANGDLNNYAAGLPALRAVCGADSDIVKAVYHAETRTVDLFDFNGCSVTVDLDTMSFHPNGED